VADVKACLMAFVYLSGAWSWIARKTADREGLPYEPCVLDRGHAAGHEAGVRVVAAQYNHLNYLRSTAEPDRDRRREAYRALQREAARKALDAWFRAVDADGSRWKEWEAFIESTAAYAACELQQKSHYGATDPDPTGALADMCSQLPGCRPSTDGQHSASCEVSIYRAHNARGAA
jgi:hypothetical protein